MNFGNVLLKPKLWLGIGGLNPGHNSLTFRSYKRLRKLILDSTTCLMVKKNMVRKPARETRNFAGGQRGFGRAPHILRGLVTSSGI